MCRYALDKDMDSENEHALARLATMILLQDLDDLDGGPARLSALASATFPAVGAVVHTIEPRHWYWAMFHEPDLQLVRRGEFNDE